MDLLQNVFTVSGKCVCCIISSHSPLLLDVFPKNKDSFYALLIKSPKKGCLRLTKNVDCFCFVLFCLSTEPYLRYLNKYTALFGWAGQSYFKVQPWKVKHCSHSACFFPFRLLSRLSWLSRSKLSCLWCNYFLVRSLSSGQNCKLGE